MIRNVYSVVSGEILLRWFPNGGGVVLCRALIVSCLAYLLAIGVKEYADPKSVLTFDLHSFRRVVADTIPWFGAVFAGTYAAFYARFASQYAYLSELYNQMMATQVSIGTESANNQKLADWKAGFVEDAENLHLARKPVFAVVISHLLKDKLVIKSYDDSVAGGRSRRKALQAVVKKVCAEVAAKYENREPEVNVPLEQPEKPE